MKNTFSRLRHKAIFILSVPKAGGMVVQSALVSPAGLGAFSTCSLIHLLGRKTHHQAPEHGNQEVEQHLALEDISDYWLLNLISLCLSFSTCKMGL